MEALAARGVDTLALSRARTRVPSGARAFTHQLGASAESEAVLEARLRRHRPGVVFHLAGPSSDEREAVAKAAEASLPLFDVCLRLPERPLVIAVSSSAVYGAGAKGIAISEVSPLAPQSYYAVAKVLQETIARRAALHGLPVIVARLFNVIGAGQSPSRVPASFVRQLTDPSRAPGAPLRVRNLEAGRDFLDARDVADALLRIAERGTVGETYNVCSGTARRVGELLEALIDRAGVSGLAVAASQDDDVAWQQGDGTRLRALGWRPVIPIGDTLDAILRRWRRATTT